MELFQILVSLSALAFSCTEAALNISEIQLSWVTNTSMEIKILESTTDTILLTPASNIPDMDTPCLFAGKLEGDPGSLVAVSGCIDSNETSLSISSMLLSGGLVDVVLVDGVTYSIKDDSETSFIVMDDDVVHAPSRIKRQVPTESEDDLLIPPPNPNPVAARFFGPLPRRVITKTDIKYDNSLLGHFRGSHSKTKQWISRVVELAKPRMAHNSLTMPITLQVGQMDHTNANLKANNQNIRSLRPRTLTSYFCKDIGGGIVGIAYLGSACRSDGFSANINELFTTFNTELRTAKVFAHELGHNLGMEHDFARKHGGSNGACNGAGLMSYGSPPDKWSQCSNADFTEWWRQEGYTCVEAEGNIGGSPSRCCAEINVQGKYFSNWMFIKQKSLYNNKAVYRSIDESYCIFHGGQHIHGGHWKIDSCDFVDKKENWSQGYGWSKIEAACPEDIGTNWRYYSWSSAGSGSGPVDPSISVNCS